MDTLTIYLAKLLGLYFFIVGLAVLFKTENFQKSIREIGGSDAIMTLISIMPLAVGLSIVLGHNVWLMHWSVLITIIGWIMLIAGVMRLFFHKKVMQMMLKKAEQKYFLMTMGVILTIVGAVLTYLGFVG
jgi:hypothetical protein